MQLRLKSTSTLIKSKSIIKSNPIEPLPVINDFFIVFDKLHSHTTLSHSVDGLSLVLVLSTPQVVVERQQRQQQQRQSPLRILGLVHHADERRRSRTRCLARHRRSAATTTAA
jgi:hypothetical protein